MARITVEDCLKQIPNRFELALIATYRAIDVQVAAYAPVANPPEAPLPLWLTFTALGRGRPASDQAEGQANEWLRLRANLTVRDFGPLKEKDKDKGCGTEPSR